MALLLATETWSLVKGVFSLGMGIYSFAKVRSVPCTQTRDVDE